MSTADETGSGRNPDAGPGDRGALDLNLEEGTSPGASRDARDGSEVTSASEGDPLDETTPVDNLE